MTQSPGPIDEKIQCQLMVRFNNYFGLAVAVLVARDDPLYGPFERGRQKLIELPSMLQTASSQGQGVVAVLSEIDNESLASSLEQSCKEQSLQQ